MASRIVSATATNWSTDTPLIVEPSLAGAPCAPCWILVRTTLRSAFTYRDAVDAGHDVAAGSPRTAPHTAQPYPGAPSMSIARRIDRIRHGAQRETRAVGLAAGLGGLSMSSCPGPSSCGGGVTALGYLGGSVAKRHWHGAQVVTDDHDGDLSTRRAGCAGASDRDDRAAGAGPGPWHRSDPYASCRFARFANGPGCAMRSA